MRYVTVRVVSFERNDFPLILPIYFTLFIYLFIYTTTSYLGLVHDIQFEIKFIAPC